MRTSLTIATSFVVLYAGLVFSMSLDEKWLFSTAYIQNQSTGKAGTGFFVTRYYESGTGKLFLVSNKHVLVPKTPAKVQTNLTAKLTVLLTGEAEDGELTVTPCEIMVRDAKGRRLYVEHPDKNVDVAAINVTDQFVESGDIKKGFKVGHIAENRFSTKESIRKTRVTPGDRAILLGYPLNMIEGRTAIPIARGGTIATPPERDFRNAPMFLVDCPTIRGSSGSPIFLPVRPYKVEVKNGHHTLKLTEGYYPELLGIMSGTVPDWELIIKKHHSYGQPPQSLAVVDTASLGVAFRAETITQTLDVTGLNNIFKEKDAQ